MFNKLLIYIFESLIWGFFTIGADCNDCFSDRFSNIKSVKLNTLNLYGKITYFFIVEKKHDSISTFDQGFDEGR